MKIFDRVSQWALPVLALIMVGITGCVSPGSVTGGGWIPSKDGVVGDKANFGFSASQCDLSLPATGSFNFHDKTSTFSAPGSIKMTGTLTDAGQCLSLPCATDSDCTATVDGSVINGICAPLSPPLGPGSICQYAGQPISNGCALCAAAASLGLPLPTKTYGFDVNYKSTNSTYPGTGTAAVCAIDSGQGHKSHDVMIINVSGGPYDGYSNVGLVQGNISAQSCP
jgi:hypothetical protein